jgi:hypothetical protein
MIMDGRRTALNSGLALVLVVATLGLTGEVARADPQVPEVPNVEGPITGPGAMTLDGRGLEAGWAAMVAAELDRGSFGAIEDAGYVREEYFVSGVAGGETYAIRALLTRPADPRRFSGQVLVENDHGVETPFGWHFTRDYLLSRGHAHLGLSTSTANVNFLVNSNPERYSRLQLDADQVSDVVAQVGRLLNSDVSPLEGIQAIHFTGYSIAAAPVWNYMNTHHNLWRLPDGAPIYDGFWLPPSRTACRLGPLPQVDVPVLWVNSQLEVQEVIVDDATDCRTPDSDDPAHPFRLYEVAGMSHYDSRYLPGWWNQPCANPRDLYPFARVVSTMLDHHLRWVADGEPPPPGQLISVLRGAGGEIEFDEHGNAVGGVRHTYLDVPIATYSPLNELTTPPDFNCTVYGSTIEFTDEQLAELYRNHGHYVSQVNRRLNELVTDGSLLREYAGEFRTEAAHLDRMR